ncbi:MAG: hypothetical protein AAF414_21405 [Pseudomonadota bacterium]
MTRPLAYLSPRTGVAAPFSDLAPEGLRLETVPEQTLTDHRPDRFGALLVPMHIDQRRFANATRWISRFFQAGGTLVFNGLLGYPFHRKLKRFEPLVSPRLRQFRVRVDANHPVWRGVDPDDLTFRRGVAGFYGRGCNPPPPSAQIIGTIDQGNCAVDWQWHPREGGRLLMHAGNDLWMYARDKTSAAALTPQLLHWCMAEELAV